MDIKMRIQSSFNKAFKTYDQHCSAQKIACEHAMSLLLDLGNAYSCCADMACGTGLSTQFLVENLDFKTLYAVDFSERLVQVARQKMNDRRVTYLISDFDTPVFAKNQMDLIFSNMGLQWSGNLLKTFLLFHSYLKSKGFFVFSVPLIETFNELKRTCRNPFLDLETYKAVLKESNYHLVSCRETRIRFDFPSSLAALKSIKAVGANVLLSEPRPDSRYLSKSALNNYFNCKDNYHLSYHIGVFVAQRKEV